MWGLNIGAAVLALSLAFIPTFAQHEGERPDTKDQGFVNKASESSMAEVKLGQLAEEKGAISAVKNFGKRMVQDHTRTAKQLKAIASQQDMTVPSGLDKGDRNTYDQLSNLSGSDFDRTYADDMVREHTDVLSDYLRETMVGQNAIVKRYAVKQLAVIDRHLGMARKMQEAVNREANHSELSGQRD